RARRAAPAREAGGDHPVHGHHRPQLLPRGLRRDGVGRQRPEARRRHPRPLVHRGRRADQPARDVGGRHRSRAGGHPRHLLPAHAHRPRAARRGRRPRGRAVHRHPAQDDLADRVVGGGPGGDRGRHHVGRQERRAVQPLAGRSEGAARPDPGRLHLGARRDRGRADRRRGREARRGLLGPARRRRDRELVRLRHRSRVPAVPSPRPLRRKNHRARVMTRRHADEGKARGGWRSRSVFYREAGQFKTSYASDQAIFPIVQDKWVVAAGVVAAFVAVPLVANEYWLQAVLIPFLIYSMAAIGLNLLTGYAGQLSLGTGGFMAVGGYAAFKLTTAFPWLNIVVVFALAGVIAALVGLVFGVPSLRIKGFYLAVATLAAQFFLIWLFNKVAWFTNYASSGTITAPPRTIAGVMVTGPL